MVKAIETNNLKQTEIGTVPIEWNIVSLNGTSTLHARIGWQGLTTDEYRTSGKFKLVSGTSFQNGKINWKKCNYVDEIRYEQDKNIQLKDQDVLVTKDGTIGKVAYVKIENEKATLNSGVFVVRPKGNFYYPKFMYYIFSSHYFVDFLNKLTAGSTIIHLYQKDFINFTFPLPSFKEQQEIATALSDMDDLIESLEKMINKKKKIKQGTMQQLLTGKKRLPGYEKDWSLKSIDSIADVQRGETLTNRTLIPGTIPVIAGGMQPAYYHAYPNRKGENITISASGANAGFVNYFYEPIFASDCSTVSSKSKEVCTKYLYYNLKRRQQEIYYLQTGGAQPHVHPSYIRPLLVSLPELKEQQAIAEILSDMDAEIEALEDKLEKYKILKEGMMQELLTGRIRLV